MESSSSTAESYDSGESTPYNFESNDLPSPECSVPPPESSLEAGPEATSEDESISVKSETLSSTESVEVSELVSHENVMREHQDIPLGEDNEFREIEKAESVSTELTYISDSKDIEDYQSKLRQSEIAYLKTQRSVLEQHGRKMNAETLLEMVDREQDKIKLLNQDEFREKIAKGNDSILGVHLDGKIYLKDNNPEILNHVVTHEATHDLSFHYESVEAGIDNRENTVCITKEYKGLRCDETVSQVDGPERQVFKRGYGLNEGVTEAYTVRELTKRGEAVPIKAYSSQHRWALKLESLVGADTLADAFYRGRLGELQQKVNELGKNNNCWDLLSNKIDEYHRNPDDSYLRWEIDELLDSLVEPNAQKVKVKKYVHLR